MAPKTAKKPKVKKPRRGTNPLKKDPKKYPANAKLNRGRKGKNIRKSIKMAAQPTTSHDLCPSAVQWGIIRNTSSFLFRPRGGYGLTFTKEPNNLKNLNAFKYNGLVHERVVDVSAAGKDGKSIMFSTARRAGKRCPEKRYNRVELLKDSRRTLNSIRRTMKGRYREDLKITALRRASAILRSQRPVKTKKSRKPAAVSK